MALAKVIHTLPSPVALATPSIIRSDPEGLVHPAGHSAWGHNLGKTFSYEGNGRSGSERGNRFKNCEKLGSVRILGRCCSLLGRGQVGRQPEKHTAGD